MAAYIIFIRDRITDAETFAAYGPKARAAGAGHAIKPLVFYGESETLEGDKVDGVVVLEFPDMAAAHAWYDSPAYQEAAAIRMKGADYRAVLVQGVGG